MNASDNLPLEFAPDVVHMVPDALAKPDYVPELLLDPDELIPIPTASDLHSFKRLRSDKCVHLAPDVYEWLSAQGPDWEDRANAILKREMLLSRGL